MKKRIFTLLLALMMCAFAVCSFAAEPPADEVLIGGTGDTETRMQVRLDGTDEDWSSSDNSVVMTPTNMANPVDFKVTLNTTVIKNAIIEWYNYGQTLVNGNATLAQYLEEWTVTGKFTVKIVFPSQIEIPAEHRTNSKALVGFNDEVADLFVETGRSVSTSGKNTTLTIDIAIKDFFAEDDAKDGITEQALYEGIMSGTYLNELTYTLIGANTGRFSSPLRVEGTLEGKTTIEIGNTQTLDAVVRFYTNTLTATLRVKDIGGGGTGTGTEYKLTFNVDGDKTVVDPIYTHGPVDFGDLTYPKKPGYTFDGWYFDAAMTEKVTGDFKISKNTTLYGTWVNDTLIDDDHFAYIIGYPDETIRPNNNITREEATMIFYRLLRDDVRDAIFTTNNTFKDIAPERWSNSAISTMANGGYILGRPDGNFDPEAPITRAEFATMTVRFAKLMDDSGASFSDIDNHWAASYILKAATATWINGYPDGTFRPDQNITRAEAMTLVNNVLNRHVNKEGLHKDTRFWIDIKEGEWYYFIVLEATNSHNYVRQDDGTNETWTEIVPNKTWK